MNNSASKLIGNISWLASSQLVSRLFRVIVAILATRSLGKLEWGEFCFAVAVASSCSFFGDLGLHNLLLRELNQKPLEVNPTFASIIRIRIFILFPAMVIIGMGYCVLKKFDPVFVLLIIVNLLVAFFDSIKDLFLAVLRSFGRFSCESLVTSSSQLCLLLLTICFIASNNTTALTLSCIYLACAALQFLGYALFSSPINLKTLVSGNSTKTFTLSSLVNEAIASSIFQMIISIILIWQSTVLGIMYSPVSSGFFNASWRFLDTLLVIPGLIFVPLTPFIHRSINKDLDTLELIKTTTRLILFLGLPSTWICILFCGDLVQVLYGQEYASIVLPSQILIFNILIGAPIYLFQIINFSSKRLVVTPKLFIGVVGINCISTLILSYFFGVTGSAIATTATFAVLVGLLSKPFWSKELLLDFGEMRLLVAGCALLAIGSILISYWQFRISLALIIILIYAALSYQVIKSLLVRFRGSVSVQELYATE